MPTLVFAALIVLLLAAFVTLVCNTIAAIIEIFVEKCYGVGASAIVLVALYATWVAVVYSAIEVVIALA